MNQEKRRNILNEFRSEPDLLFTFLNAIKRWRIFINLLQLRCHIPVNSFINQSDSFRHIFAAMMLQLLVFGAVTILNACLAKGENLVTTDENYCPYFKNRAPTAQPNLQNCTWYKEKACCLQSEVNLIFYNVRPPVGASEKCARYMNFLMCYVCAPDQNLFYKDERLTVCKYFCEKWFSACADAKLKGVKIKDLFKSGTEFCNARKFVVKSGSNTGCFSFELETLTSAVTCTALSFPRLYQVIITLAVYLNGR